MARVGGRGEKEGEWEFGQSCDRESISSIEEYWTLGGQKGIEVDSEIEKRKWGRNVPPSSREMARGDRRSPHDPEDLKKQNVTMSLELLTNNV